MAGRKDSGGDQQNGLPPDYENFKFQAEGRLSQNNCALVEQLDKIEGDVEAFRKSAGVLTDQKELLTSSISQMIEKINSAELTGGHREELQAYTDRVMMRLFSVTVKVDIPRSEMQERARTEITEMMNELQIKIDHGIGDIRATVQAYLNACSSDQEGPIDSQFQHTLLACALDDQKQVKKTLLSWLGVLDSMKDMWNSKSNIN